MSDEKIYLVGYGKTPVHTRYTKGQSGNPSGKAKARPENGRVLIEQILRQKVDFSVGGKRRRISLAEATARTHVHQAAKGNLKSVAVLLWLRRHWSEQGGGLAIKFVIDDEPAVGHRDAGAKSRSEGPDQI